MKYYVDHLLGTFIFDSTAQSISQTEKSKIPSQCQPLPHNLLSPVLLLLKEHPDQHHTRELYRKNLQQTKQDLKNAVQEDQLIIQAISSIEELDRTINLLTKRLREWQGLYFPELGKHIENHERFVELVLERREDLQKKLQIAETMGANLAPQHVAEMQKLAKTIVELFSLRKHHEEYLTGVMKNYCPNMLELAGTTIGAKLLELAKGLKRIALLPASTIQLLGAEKALFRHLKTHAKSPKYGVLFKHPLVQRAPRPQRGKAARILADKLSLCARLDYFKGEFKGKEYYRELEEKILKNEQQIFSQQDTEAEDREYKRPFAKPEKRTREAQRNAHPKNKNNRKKQRSLL